MTNPRSAPAITFEVDAAPGHTVSAVPDSARTYRISCSCGGADFTLIPDPGHTATVARFHGRDLAHAAGDHSTCLLNTCSWVYRNRVRWSSR